MIGPGDVYDIQEEIETADADRLRVVARKLLDEVHRLRHLVEDMADFRHSREHDAAMKKLGEIKDSLKRPKPPATPTPERTE